MLKIKLTRIGKRHEPHYRIIVIPERTKREGRAVEQLGYYNPRTKEITVKKDRIKHWLSVGAQPTNTVHDLLAKQKLLEPRKRIKGPDKKKKKEASTEEKATETKQQAPTKNKEQVKKEETAEVKGKAPEGNKSAEKAVEPKEEK